MRAGALRLARLRALRGLGEEYAPELDLLGVAAAAPALNLPEIMGAQWVPAGSAAPEGEKPPPPAPK